MKITGKKISELEERTELGGGEYIPFEDNGDNGKVKVDTIKNLVNTNNIKVITNESEFSIVSPLVQAVFNGDAITASQFQEAQSLLESNNNTVIYFITVRDEEIYFLQQWTVLHYLPETQEIAVCQYIPMMPSIMFNATFNSGIINSSGVVRNKNGAYNYIYSTSNSGKKIIIGDYIEQNGETITSANITLLTTGSSNSFLAADGQYYDLMTKINSLEQRVAALEGNS